MSIKAVCDFEGALSTWRGIFELSTKVCGEHSTPRSLFFLDSSMVEHTAVNRGVVGSSPTRGVEYLASPSWRRRTRLVRSFAANIVSRRVNIWLLGQAVKTSPFHGGNTGSIPVGVIALWHKDADVAQLAEQLICNQQVIGSSPIIGFLGPIAQLVRASGS